MIRVVLAVYLALVSAVGPWACCCAPARLASRLFAPSSPGASPCCGHKASADRPAQAPAPCRDGPRSPLRPGCPCKEGPVLEAVLPPSSGDTAAAALRLTGEWPSAPAGPGLGSPLPAGGPAAWPWFAAPPFLSTHDLLCVHHVLRC
jgi:hypothetical protein